MANINDFYIIKTLLIILCISILGLQSLAINNPNSSTTNGKMVEALQPPESRIAIGVEAKEGQFPFQVFVTADIYGCGGVIIDNYAIVTAAQCVYVGGEELIPANKIAVSVGDVNRNLLEKFQVNKVIPHGQYNPETNDNDIAILITKTSLWNGEPTKKIAPISITSSKLAENTECIVSGWGQTNSIGTVSTKLMYTNLNIFNQKTCKQQYGIPDSTICALSTTSNICLGDAGGPLIVKSKQTGNVSQLIGIVSLGVRTCAANMPSVYTDVFQYREWIEKNKNSFEISYQIISSSQFLSSILLSSFIMYFK